MKQETNKTNHFVFEGVDTTQLAERYGTPLYVMSENRILDRCKEIHDSFLTPYENTRAVFASKAFLSVETSRLVTREGLGVDVCSGGELYTAIQAGVPMEQVIFHGNNKSIAEIQMAVDYQVGRVVVDNEYELIELNRYASEKNIVMPILYRITPGVDSHTHKFISTGQLDSKFGIPLDRSVRNHYIQLAMDASNVDLLGFHFHVGSQLHENTSHLAAVDIVMDLVRDVKNELGFLTKELNLGGGFGVKYTEEDDPKPLSYFIQPMMEKVTTRSAGIGIERPAVIIEPGRWIVAEAGITLYTIGAIKEIPGIRTYVSVDGGLPDNPRPALYQAKYDAVLANKFNQPNAQTVTIAGKCCESGDILIWDLPLPTVSSGDLLAVLCTGAYNYSMASNYNRLPRPAVVMIKDGIDRVIVKRETYDDILAREL